jgi:ribonuclease D
MSTPDPTPRPQTSAPADETNPHARRARYARSRYRSASHESAHAEDAAGEASAKVTHPLVPPGDAPLIATPHALTELIDHLRDVGSFAYDSEFIGELTYVPKLCLIQVASAKRVALIDPLDGLDLRPFWELLADPAVEKIVHAGQQDIEPVFRHTGKPAANVFDTQIGAAFTGMAYPVALSKLVAEVVGAKLGKALTFSHWDQRPLSAIQLKYAADDVRYLPAVRAELGRRIDTLGHTAWASEEFAALCEPSQYVFNPDVQYTRVRGATSLQPSGLAVLKELVVWRDAAAKAHDVPPRAFLKDEILVDLSRSPVKTIEKLDRVKGLPRPVEVAHGKEIVDATLRALSSPAARQTAPRRDEPTPTERFRADALWAVAQALCIGQSIDPALVTSRQEIGEFYRRAIGKNDAPDIGILRGWRRAALGDPLERLMTGGGRIAFEWTDGTLRAASAT